MFLRGHVREEKKKIIAGNLDEEVHRERDKIDNGNRILIGSQLYKQLLTVPREPVKLFGKKIPKSCGDF